LNRIEPQHYAFSSFRIAPWSNSRNSDDVFTIQGFEIYGVLYPKQKQFTFKVPWLTSTSKTHAPWLKQVVTLNGVALRLMVDEDDEPIPSNEVINELDTEFYKTIFDAESGPGIAKSPPYSLNVKGAGLENCNGIYEHDGDLNGKPRYKKTKAERYIYWDGEQSCWFLCNGPRVKGHNEHYYKCSSTSQDVPERNWEKMKDGQAPPPKIKRVSRILSGHNTDCIIHTFANVETGKLSREHNKLAVRMKKQEKKEPSKMGVSENANIHTSRPLTPKDMGVQRFEIAVDEVVRGENRVCFGLCPSKEYNSDKVLKGAALIYWDMEFRKFKVGSVEVESESFQEGDRVGFELSVTSGEVVMFRNGRRVRTKEPLKIQRTPKISYQFFVSLGPGSGVHLVHREPEYLDVHQARAYVVDMVGKNKTNLSSLKLDDLISLLGVRNERSREVRAAWRRIDEVIVSYFDRTGCFGDDLQSKIRKDDLKQIEDPQKRSTVEQILLARCYLLLRYNELFKSVAHLLTYAPPRRSGVPAQSNLGLRKPLLTLQDRIRGARHVLFSKTKMKPWMNALDKTKRRSSDACRVTINRFLAHDLRQQKMVDWEGKYSVFGQLMVELQRRESAAFLRVPYRMGGRDQKQAFHVSFVDEAAYDASGVYRQTLEDIAKELQSPNLPLFQLCQNAKNEVYKNRDSWVPCAPSDTPNLRKSQIRQLEFLGQIMGLALRSRNYLNLRIAPFFWKVLVGDTITLEDVKGIDYHAGQLIEDAIKLVKKQRRERARPNMENISESKVAVTQTPRTPRTPRTPSGTSSTDLSMMVMSRTTSQGGAGDIALPGSREKLMMSEKNLPKIQHAFKSQFDVQCAAVLRGLSTVVPVGLFNLFTAADLERLVCGSRTVDLELLKENTEYSFCDETDEHVQYFWAAMETFEQEDLQLFLTFVWGRSRLPLSSKEWGPKPFKITTCGVNRGAEQRLIDQTLPVSHTCFFILELPRYSSMKVAREQILYACRNCTVMDLT